jgi:23S rRNA pseudouridine1911/1915/1917 synthase
MKTSGFKIVYEDNHLLIVNKNSGILTQGDKTGDVTLPDLAKNYLRERYDKPGNIFCGVVHRLDRPVSGLVVLAKTSKGLERMNELFQKRKVNKVYWAVTEKNPPKKADRLVHYLSKDEKSNTVQVFDYDVPETQKAELKYKVLGVVNKNVLIEVSPLTGRPHQIRAQLAHIGCPIKGDVKYGSPRPAREGRIYLHARRLDFIHPVKNEPVICIAGLPDDSFWNEFLVLDDFVPDDRHLPYLHGS